MAITLEGFSIREYTSKVRTINLEECWPFDGEPIQGFLPPLTTIKLQTAVSNSGFAKPGAGKAVLRNTQGSEKLRKVEERRRRRLGLKKHLGLKKNLGLRRRLNGWVLKKKKKKKTNTSKEASSHKRVYSSDEITKTVPKVFSGAFEDVMQQAAQISGVQDANSGNAGQTVDLFARQIELNKNGHIVSNGRGQSGPGELMVPLTPLIQNPLHPVYHSLFNFQGFVPVQLPNIPMQPTVTMPFPGTGLQGEVFQQHNAVGELSMQFLNPWAQLQTLNENVQPDHRTLFVTFSRGHTATAEELHNYFTINYRDVIEAIIMPRALYACIVFRLPTTITTILNGQERAKFVINGKQVWTRRFVPRC